MSRFSLFSKIANRFCGLSGTVISRQQAFQFVFNKFSVILVVVFPVELVRYFLWHLCPSYFPFEIFIYLYIFVCSLLSVVYLLRNFFILLRKISLCIQFSDSWLLIIFKSLVCSAFINVTEKWSPSKRLLKHMILGWFLCFMFSGIFCVLKVIYTVSRYE